MGNVKSPEGLSQYSTLCSSGSKKTRMKWSMSMPLRGTSVVVMKHRVLTFSWCKISLKLTNCREIFWFLNRLYWMRNHSVEKFSAGSLANWVNSWWADHVTAGEGWRHVRVKPPALEQPLIKCHCLEQEAGLDKNDSVWHLRSAQMAPHQALPLQKGHSPSCYQSFSQQPLQTDKSGHLRQEPEAGPKSASKFQADVKCGSMRKIVRGAVLWNRPPGTCARVFC